MPKKQPNKVGMTPQYSYGLSSLYLLPFFQLAVYMSVTWDDRILYCGVAIWSFFIGNGFSIKIIPLAKSKVVVTGGRV